MKTPVGVFRKPRVTNAEMYDYRLPVSNFLTHTQKLDLSDTDSTSFIALQIYESEEGLFFAF